MREPETTNRLAGLIEAAMDTRGGDPIGIAQVLLAAGVFLPPPNAERREGRVVTYTPHEEIAPFPHVELTHENGRVYAGHGQDVTEAYHEWLSSLPGTISVTFEWPEEPPICPECRDGKHRNCDGTAWHEEMDVRTRCRCEHGKGGGV